MSKRDDRNNSGMSGSFQNDSYVVDMPTSSAPARNNQILFTKVDQKELIDMVKSKNKVALHDLGGAATIATSLGSDPENGIDGYEVNKRREIFGSNTYCKRTQKGFFHFLLNDLKANSIIFIFALLLASYFLPGRGEPGAKHPWREGLVMLCITLSVSVVSATCAVRKEVRFQQFMKRGNDFKVEVMRDGRRIQVSIFDIVVGDVVILKLGVQIPADGLFLSGHFLQVDESSMTRESDCVELNSTENPFLLSGTKVVDGYGQMLVTSVGMDTAWGEMMSSISRDSVEQTPLQVHLDKLNTSIGKVGFLAAFLILVVMLVRYFTRNTTDDIVNTEYNGRKTGVHSVFNSVIRIVAVAVTRIVSAAVTIAVVAISERFPLAVTLILAYTIKRMKKQTMVRKLSACVTMGSATVLCTDKTGTLTSNQMKVTKFWLGQEFNEAETSSHTIPETVHELINQGVGLNTSGSVYQPSPKSKTEISGSPTEKAILSWAVTEFGMDMVKLEKSYAILHVETFNSEKKRSGVLVKKLADNTIHQHWKGAAEMILSMCSSYFERNGETYPLDSESRTKIENIIQGMAASSLRCIAFAYRQISEEEEKNSIPISSNLKEDGFTLMGIVGIKDPCKPGVKEVVETCKSAGVSVKMITGDNIFTAKTIATECGILDLDHKTASRGEVIEGFEFRNYSNEERLQRVDQIKVMARSSPFDKLLMVQCLKQKGHVVAVTGDGTNDAPALKEADIGLSMGIGGTEFARESSDIVILDDNFTTVATVLKWGRCVYNNIQKFIQFQLTVNIVALTINFIAAVSAGEVPLTAVQLLWVNLIMDTLAALALATERPNDELMRKPPVGRTEPLITNVMWRNLLAQALYQITVLLIFQFQGSNIFKVSERVNDTLIFNTFVLCQIFNEFNSRKLVKQNVFEGILKDHLFLGIVGVTFVLQVVMVEFLNKFADTTNLNGWQWGLCIAIPALSWPIGWIVNFLPVSDRPF